MESQSTIILLDKKVKVSDKYINIAAEKFKEHEFFIKGWII